MSVTHALSEATALDGRMSRLKGEPSRLRRRMRDLAAFSIATVFHVAILTIWWNARIPQSLQPAADLGAGGMSLSLVSGSFGGGSDRPAAASSLAPAAQEAEMDAPASKGEIADAAPLPGSTMSASAPSAPELAATAGATSTTSGAASASAVGSGSDAWARASFFPTAPPDQTAVALWGLVTRCYHPAIFPSQPLRLLVVLDASGQFIEAYPEAPSPVPESPDGPTAQLVEALKSCGPYPGLNTTLASRVLLVTPVDPQPLHAG